MNHLTELVVGILLVIVGILSIVHKQFSLALGRGRGLFTLHITDARAVLFGITSIIGAAIALVPWMYINFTNNVAAQNDSTLPFFAIAGIGTAAFGFTLSTFFEFLHSIRIRANAKNSDEKQR